MRYNPLQLPEKSIVERVVPKKAFYKNAQERRKSTLQSFLTEQVERITWLYKLHPLSLQIPKGEEKDRVQEIDIFECHLKTPELDYDLLAEMDQLIPRQTLYLLHHPEGAEPSPTLWMQWKATHPNAPHLATPCYEQRPFDPHTEHIQLQGAQMEQIYAQILAQVSGLKIQTLPEYCEARTLLAKQDALQKEYKSLRRKIANERQFARQIELNDLAKALQAEITQIKAALAPYTT